MKLKFHATGTELHMSSGDAAPFIAAGLAEEVIERQDFNTQTPPPAPELRFWIGRGKNEHLVLFWKGTAPGQNINGGCYTYEAAKSEVVYFQGKAHRPPQELVDQMRGVRQPPAESLFMGHRADYGHDAKSRPWEPMTLSEQDDYDVAKFHLNTGRPQEGGTVVKTV